MKISHHLPVSMQSLVVELKFPSSRTELLIRKIAGDKYGMVGFGQARSTMTKAVG